MEKSPFFEKIEQMKMAYRVLILVGTIVFLGGLFIWLVVLPKTGEIAKTKKEINALNQQLVQARIRARNLKKFEAEQAEVTAQFQEALKLLPNEREIPSLLRTITQLGTDSQLKFLLFSPKKERVKNFYIEIPVAIKVSGTYHNVASFFDKVGRMERIVNILDVSMKPNKPLSTTLITTCNAMTYRFKGTMNATSGAKKKK
ncbi:MAG: type 4a pilus biogenesis protein PilO [Desulfatiglandaceae bacterium]|jgi:type IV pilus assembly protein PilO